MSIKKKLFIILANSLPFGLLFFLLCNYFNIELKIWQYVINAVFYGVIALLLRPKLIKFFNKESK